MRERRERAWLAIGSHSMAVGKSMCASSSLSNGKGEGGNTFKPLVVAEVSAGSLDVLTLRRYGSDARVWNV